jgi:hypothetical protein
MGSRKGRGEEKRAYLLSPPLKSIFCRVLHLSCLDHSYYQITYLIICATVVLFYI